MAPTIKRSLVVAVIAIAGVFASVGTADAASPARVSVHAVSTWHVHGITSAKNSTILPKGPPNLQNFKFKPNRIKVPDCSNPSVTLSFTITNHGNVAQQLEIDGSPLGGVIPVGSTFGYCASAGLAGGTFQITLGRSSSTALLTITVIR